MRGLKGSYGLAGLITFFLCGFLILESAGFAGVATAQVSINSPSPDSIVKGTVANPIEEGRQDSVGGLIHRRGLSGVDSAQQDVVEINQYQQRVTYYLGNRIRFVPGSSWKCVQAGLGQK